MFRAPGVLLTTYGMVQHNAELFCAAPGGLDAEEDDEDRPLWDFLILDEVRPFLRSPLAVCAAQYCSAAIPSHLSVQF